MKKEWRKELSNALKIAQRCQRLALGTEHTFDLAVYPIIGNGTVSVFLKNAVITYMAGIDSISEFEEEIMSHLKELGV